MMSNGEASCGSGAPCSAACRCSALSFARSSPVGINPPFVGDGCVDLRLTIYSSGFIAARGCVVSAEGETFSVNRGAGRALAAPRISGLSPPHRPSSAQFFGGFFRTAALTHPRRCPAHPPCRAPMLRTAPYSIRTACVLLRGGHPPYPPGGRHACTPRLWARRFGGERSTAGVNLCFPASASSPGGRAGHSSRRGFCSSRTGAALRPPDRPCAVPPQPFPCRNSLARNCSMWASR